QEGERGETIHYIWGPDLAGSLGLRERPLDAGQDPVDRYALGLHHLAFEAPSRKVVDEAARWLRDQGAEIEGGPGERHYTPGYYAVFFFDPDGIKLEVVHRPSPFSLSFARGLVRGAGSLANRRRRRRSGS
ncbi:MAG: VOC family protein, partial [Solirubrobacterales bacterium]